MHLLQCCLFESLIIEVLFLVILYRYLRLVRRKNRYLGADFSQQVRDANQNILTFLQHLFLIYQNVFLLQMWVTNIGIKCNNYSYQSINIYILYYIILYMKMLTYTLYYTHHLHIHVGWVFLSHIQARHETLPPLNVTYPWVLH